MQQTDIPSTRLFFELIQVGIGQRAALSAVPTAEEWDEIYETAKKQTLIGVAFSGVERLPVEQRPRQALLLQWFALTRKIEEQNKLVNRRAAELTMGFQKLGYRSCVLKGQGNALLYPEPLRRQSGDIDIWLDGDRTEIVRRARRMFGNVPFKYQHVEFPCLKDVEVEVHYFPMYMQNPVGNLHLQRFFRREKERQFSHRVALPDGVGEMAMPTPDFNAVYQLTHVFIHFIIEGIGLRHFLDYFYVLRNLQPERRTEVVRMLKKINLYGFARAVMYVERALLGLEEEYLIVPVDERRGRRLVEEILQGGNFGRYETRFWHKGGGFVDRQWQKIRRNARSLFDYPGEIFFEPFFRLYHAAWRAWMRAVRL